MEKDVEEMDKVFEENKNKTKDAKRLFKKLRRNSVKTIRGAIAPTTRPLVRSENKKNLVDATKKLSRVSTLKTKEKYVEKVLELSSKLVEDYESTQTILNDLVNSNDDLKEKYDSLLDSVLRHVSKEKRDMAQIRRTGERGIHILSELEIGNRIGSDYSVFSTKYFNNV